MSSPLTEKEFAAMLRLSARVAQDVLTPALVEHFNNRVCAMAAGYVARLDILEGIISQQNRQIMELTESVQTLRVAVQTIAGDWACKHDQ